MSASRVRIGTHEALFRSMHRHYVDDLHTVPDWSRFDAGDISDSVREELRRAWSARVVAEYRSMVVFSEMIARLPEAGLPLEISCAASRLLTDEARHVELCSQLAERLGGSQDATVNRAELRFNDEGLSAELFVARWTLSMMCVGECASVALLKALADAADEPVVNQVLDTLYRDEVLHDRFGWALARELVPMLNEEQREWLSADLAFSFAHYDRIHGRRMRKDGEALPEAKERTDGGDRLGLVSPETYARAWYHRLDTVIMPGIRSLGLAANEAWALRDEAAAVVERR